jgi:hypothetical protein
VKRGRPIGNKRSDAEKDERGASSTGRNVQGTHRPRNAASKGRIVPGMHRQRTYVRGRIGRGHIVIASLCY